MRSKLAGLCREPLVHFLVIGAAFFLLWQFLGDPRTAQDELTARREHIVITPGHVERLAQHWTKTHLRPPSAEELAGLVEQEIDEEILYREAVAMGLDRDDLVIRRRLAVKMDFLTDDAAAMAAPTDEQLQAFLSQHPDKFNLESLSTFAHVYIDPSKHPQGASEEAKRMLALLNDRATLDWKKLGDSIPLPSEYEAASDAELARLFGREFPKRLSEMPVGRWSGPVKSGYGLHLVQVRKRTAMRVPPLKEVREAVLSEWQTAQRLELSSNLRRQRRARYTVTVQWPDWAKEAEFLPAKAGPPGGAR